MRPGAAWAADARALVVVLAVGLARLTAIGPANDAAEQWLLRLPVSAYLGWATIATVAGSGTTARWAGVDVADAAATWLAVAARAGRCSSRVVPIRAGHTI